MHDEPSTCSGRTPGCSDSECSIEYGTCHCGCGDPVLIAARSSTRMGLIRGCPKRFRAGHNSKLTGGFTPEGRRKIRAAQIGKKHSEETRAKIRAARARQHGEKHPRWAGSDVGYFGIHIWLNRNFPRSGECEHCGRRDKPTEYASLTGHVYTRNREDYAELCVKCHRRMDFASV